MRRRHATRQAGRAFRSPDADHRHLRRPEPRGAPSLAPKSSASFPMATPRADRALRPWKRLALPDDAARDENAVDQGDRGDRRAERNLLALRRDLARRHRLAPPPTHLPARSPATPAFARGLCLALRDERARQARRAMEAGSPTRFTMRASFGACRVSTRIRRGACDMTASAWVNGGKGTTIHLAVVPTSLGAMLVAATEQGRVPSVVRRRTTRRRKSVSPPPIWSRGRRRNFPARCCGMVVDAVEAPVNGFDPQYSDRSREAAPRLL